MKAPSPDYRIGEIVPMPRDYDPQQLVTQMLKRSQTIRPASLCSYHPAVAAARKTMIGRAEALARAADPFEQARTFLRRTGFSPVAKVSGVHHVGRHRFGKDADVMAFARSKGWQG